ncbi:hypothetical protein J5N97_015784 [Dioscorea zingiberensis]|uniref:AB hydrolase-1 domain-containing protein n=1 Tax=Dioscorea zingiberensis TaxID=325984 RepID=A0A9D5HEQ1_9LILI|nr:hypothetical protein J5N97_015784 [Dioscorea zingiberensis]
MRNDNASKAHCSDLHHGHHRCSGCFQPSKAGQDVHVVEVYSGIKQQVKDLGLISDDQIPVKVGFSETSIMSSCVKPIQKKGLEPIVLLHGFDSSCLEWRYTYPLLENAGLETWAVDVLGWGFSDLEPRPACSVGAKREHLYQLWRSYIDRPMVLVGPSLGAAVSIDFAANHPEAVCFSLRKFLCSLFRGIDLKVLA